MQDVQVPGGKSVGVDCGYGTSRLRCRAPRRRLDRPFIAALGGSETFAAGIERPWPVILEADLEGPVVNLAAPGAGVDAFLNDPLLTEVCGNARVTILMAPQVGDLSNEFYRVHPRRNDRFICAEPLLRDLFPEVDFVEFAFTGHLLAALARRSSKRFSLVTNELRAVWVSRVRRLLGAVPDGAVLLWADPSTGRPPLAYAVEDDGVAVWSSLITPEMIAQISPLVRQVVRIELRSGRSVGHGGTCRRLDRTAHAHIAAVLGGLEF